MSRVRGGEAIRSAARRIHKFRGRDFILWNLASLLNRTWPKSFSYTDSRGLRFLLDLNDPAYRALYLFGQYERDLLWAIENLLEEGDTFVEAGTSVGVYTAIAARRVGITGKVFGFEPLDSARRTAEQQLRLNGLTNVSIAPHALGAEPGSAKIFSFSGLPTGHASLANLAPNGVGQTCKILPLDSALRGLDRGRIRLIKLDVEGSEFAALKGAAGTIEATRPRIIVEANAETSAAFGYEFSEVEAWFAGRDYQGFIWRDNAWEELRGLNSSTTHNVLFVWSGDAEALRTVRGNRRTV